jgi:pimeloyl-ACP methyl ester carboxylesterase
MWRRLLADLAGYRRLALDHMGMGLSSRPAMNFRLSERLSHFERWLDSLSLSEPVHLLVHDWGGPIGLGWAVRHPEKVASLTLMNTGLSRPKGYRLPIKLSVFKACSFSAKLFSVDLNLFVQGLIRTGTVRPLTKAAESGFLAPYRRAAHRRAVGAFIGDIPLKSSHPSAPPLASIDQGLSKLAGKPTLLAWGMGDFVFGQAFLDDLKSRLPNSEVLALESAGHWLLEDEPGAVLSAVSRHLARATALRDAASGHGEPSGHGEFWPSDGRS